MSIYVLMTNRLTFKHSLISDGLHLDATKINSLYVRLKRPVSDMTPINRDFANIAPILASDDDKNQDNERDNERGVAIKSRPKTKKPSMYRVVLMNDDYTPMEFVVMILMGIFNKTSEEAHTIMLNVHQKGVGTCGVYTFEIAETKVAQVMDAAKRNQHPLQCTLEKA